MESTCIIYKPIGIIRSPFKEPKGTPIQPSGANNVFGEIEIFQKYADGLKDLDGFSHIVVLYHLHLIQNFTLKATPFMDNQEHGVFSTRSPARPNPIGLSVLKLIAIEKNWLKIQNIDIVDGTPVLDIKPYVPHFDAVQVEKIGWLENNVHKQTQIKDDGRFIK